MSKIVVAHAGKQHSFKTAEALVAGGYEVHYITTVYDKKGSVTNIAKKILGKSNLKRANSRKSENLKDSHVVQFYEVLGLTSLLLMRIDKKRTIYTWWNKRLYELFSKRVAKYCLKNGIEILIMYDGQAHGAFEILKNKKIVKILDMSAASLPFMKKIYEKDMQINPRFSSNLKKYSDFIFDRDNQKNSIKEIELSDSLLVPSEFSKRTLAGLTTENTPIFLNPYGFDKSNDNVYSKISQEKKDGVVSLIYTGSVNQRKGISYLLEAVDAIRQRFTDIEINLKLLGIYDKEDEAIRDYLNKFSFLGLVTKDKVKEELMVSDLFIFPSLSDSFSFSVIEALSLGVPVICSDNTGAADFISNGVNGYVFKTQNKQELINILEYYISDLSRLKELKKTTIKRAKALDNTWDKYNRILLKIIEEVKSYE